MKCTKLSLLLVLTVIVTPCVSTIDVADAAPSVAGADKGENSMPLKVERLDPAVDRIIPTGASLERIATGFTWLEGPVWVKDSLYFADIPSNSIHKWTQSAGVSTFLQPSGYKGAAPFGGPEPGSNGMTLDSRGRLTVAGHA
jgi:gluconolactonase